MEDITVPDPLSLAALGTPSAGLLAGACRLDLESRDSLRLEVVKDLAEDLKTQFDSLARIGAEEVGTGDLLAEAALLCADLANLAACNLSELSPDAAPQAAASVHLAAGTAHALSRLAEHSTGKLEDAHSDNVRRDARGTRWRADLAVRQVEEFA